MITHARTRTKAHTHTDTHTHTHTHQASQFDRISLSMCPRVELLSCDHGFVKAATQVRKPCDGHAHIRHAVWIDDGESLLVCSAYTNQQTSTTHTYNCMNIKNSLCHAITLLCICRSDGGEYSHACFSLATIVPLGVLFDCVFVRAFLFKSSHFLQNLNNKSIVHLWMQSPSAGLQGSKPHIGGSSAPAQYFRALPA